MKSLFRSFLGFLGLWASMAFMAFVFSATFFGWADWFYGWNMFGPPLVIGFALAVLQVIDPS